MKENATHIRLIRDDNGKPVEAEYDIFDKNLTYEFSISFNNWARANHIPVIGGWPADKNVYAMDEVEEVKWHEWFISSIGKWSPCLRMPHHYTEEGHKTRRVIALRVKATLSEQHNCDMGHDYVPELGFDNTIKDYRCQVCSQLESKEQPQQEATLSDDRQSEVTVKEGEQPKQEAHTIEQLYKEFCDEYNIHKAYRYAEVWEASDVIEFAKRVKQQYQQEVIEKLEEERQAFIHMGKTTEAAGIAFAIDYVIQSTK